MDAFPRVFRSSDPLPVARRRVLLGLLCLAAGVVFAPRDAWAASSHSRLAAAHEDARQSPDGRSLPGEWEHLQARPPPAVAPQPWDYAPLELPFFDIARGRDLELAAYVAGRPSESCGEGCRCVLLCHPAHARLPPLPYGHPQLPPALDPLPQRMAPTVRSRSPPSPASPG